MSYSIEINNISKSYYPKRTKGERFKDWFFPFYKNKAEPFWALRDIRFKVSKGESVGIIGMNGAGKSTLLKIITGTTTPTRGTIHTSGRIVALLELGMGFYHEFTGRQNIMLAGQLIGLSADEITSKMCEIEDFAEIGKFIDDPVRTYSSGMQMRLAFALATAVRPDVLIIDEALSVGDAYFQQKSFARIRKFREDGTTLLFVSHDKSSILTLCDRAVLLNKGAMLLDNEPSLVFDYYNSLIAEKSGGDVILEQVSENKRVRTVSGNKQVYFANIYLLNHKDEKCDTLSVGETAKIVAEFISNIDCDDVVFGFLIKARTGMEIYGTNTYLTGQKIALKKDCSKRVTAEFQANIGAGIYSISVALHTERTHLIQNYHWVDLAVTFTVVNIDKCEFAGVASLPSQFIIS